MSTDEKPYPPAYKGLMAHLRRVIIIGPTGSGKSTLAENLAKTLGTTYIELDALNWEPNWTEAPDETFRERVANAVKEREWVVAGNYSKARDVLWPKATAVIWLEYPFRIVSWRLFWRTMRRCFTQEELWSGNRERLYTHFFTQDSLFLWLLKSYWRTKKTYPVAFTEFEHRHLKIIHFHSPNAAERWMKTVEVLARRRRV